MKDTYSTCVQTMARLDTILDKIETSMAQVQIEDIKEEVSNAKVEKLIESVKVEKPIDSVSVMPNDNVQILPINIKKNK